MVNVFAVYKALLHIMMKQAGVRPQTVEIKPGTIMNFWVPNESTKKTKTNQEKNKPVVVLLHGFATDGILTWQFQVGSLTSEYAVYVPDFLFFGGSFTDSTERSPEFQAKCLAKGLRKLGVERCIVVGFSYGGMVGFKMAELYPDLVESMVVCCSVWGLTKSISDACLERIGFSCWSDYMHPTSVDGVKIFLSVATYKLPWFPDWFYKNYLEVMFNNRKEQAELLEALVISDSEFKIPNLPQKIHLLCGKNDKIFNNEIEHNFKEQLGEGTTLQYINEAGHLVQLERPFVFNRHLKEILASLVADGHQRKIN